jgi:hypothetical protein
MGNDRLAMLKTSAHRTVVGRRHPLEIDVPWALPRLPYRQAVERALTKTTER